MAGKDLHSDPDGASDTAPELLTLRISVCRNCVDRVPGECHVPGCFYWMHSVDDVPTCLEYYVDTPEDLARAELGRANEKLRDGERRAAETDAEMNRLRRELDGFRVAVAARLSPWLLRWQHSPEPDDAEILTACEQAVADHKEVSNGYARTRAELARLREIVAAATALVEHWRAASNGGADYVSRNAKLLSRLAAVVLYGETT